MSTIDSVKDLIIRKGVDFKPAELDDMFTPISKIQQETNTIFDKLQDRAINAQNAFNELAIKMSEYNAISGSVDEEALATKVKDAQSLITEKVDKDGGWFFADTAVTDTARKFLTDDGVKTILNNKAQFDALMQQNEASDAPEEYKAANREMILERFNAAGGSLGSNGKQSILSFGSALGKGHDRSVYEKELLEMMKAWKADKRSVFSAQFINDVTDLINRANTDPKVQAIAQKIIAERGGKLSGVLTRDSTIESISENEIREVFTAVISNKPEFKEAMVREAEINKWLAKKQGGDNIQLVHNMIKQQIASDPKMQQVLLMNSEFKDLSESQKQVVINNPLLIQKYIDEGTFNSIPDIMQQDNETAEAYNERMGFIYDNIYMQSNIDSMLNLAKIGAYTAQESKTDLKWFDNLLLQSLKAQKEQLDKINVQMSEKIGFTRANLPANSMLQIADANIETATKALNNAKATMAKYEKSTNPTDINLYQEAQKAAIDAENIIKQNNSMLSSVYNQLDFNNPEHLSKINKLKKTLLSKYDGLDKKEIELMLNNAETIDEIADIFLNAENDTFKYYDMFAPNIISAIPGKGIASSSIKKEPINKQTLNKYFFNIASDLGLGVQTTPITLFTPISNNKQAFSDALDGIGKVLMNNIGVWNFAMASLGDDPKNAKFLKDIIGMPLSSSEDFADIFGSRKSGSGDKTNYQISSNNLSIGADATGRLYLKVTIPPQGENQVQKEAILYTDDDGANLQLRRALTIGTQCSYNQAMTNPYDFHQRQTANELMAYAGNIEGLEADLADITDPKVRNLNRFNTVNDFMVRNVSQAINAIIADKRISLLGNKYPITSGSFKYNITKTQSGVYMVDVLQYNKEIGKYVNVMYNGGRLNETFSDDYSFRMNFPALVYKLNHANELKDNFAPTQPLTPSQITNYTTRALSNPLML